MRLTKALGFAGALILAALVGGILIGSAFASHEAGETGSPEPHGEYCELFIETLAKELGVSREALAAAGQAAATASIDAAVAAGDLDEERADAMRERIAARDGSGCRLFGGHDFGRGFAHGFARGFLGGDVLEAAADALGIESSELAGQLREAGSLEALAQERGMAYDEVKATVLGAVEADLEAAVAEGLDRERADAALDRLKTWFEDGGQLNGLRHRFGPGSGGPRHWGSPAEGETDGDESGT